MKMTIIQTLIVIEEDEQSPPARRPQVSPFAELLNRLCREAAHGRITQQPEREDKEHGPYVPQ